MTFADELARMHAAIDDVFALDAKFRPASGAIVDCKVEQHLPELAFEQGQAAAIVSEATFKVLVASLAKRPSKGDVFEVGTVDWRVIESAQIEDDDRMRYTVKVERS